MPRHLSGDLTVASLNNLGESILWDDRCGELVWIDIHRGRVERWSGTGGRTTTDVGRRIGAIGLRSKPGLVAAFDSGFALLSAEADIEQELPTVEADLPSTRLNDGKVDRQGRLVCGGMDEGDPQRPISAVYCLDPSGQVRRTIGDIACANSIAFSPDGTLMYFSDMPTGTILVYDYDVDEGVPHSPRIFADGSEHPGLPDGSTVDAYGCLWNARWGAGTVIRYAPDGTVDTVVRVPAANPTCPAFGGDDLATLFITSARFGRTADELADEPLAGSVFAVSPGVAGVSEPRFAG